MSAGGGRTRRGGRPAAPHVLRDVTSVSTRTVLARYADRRPGRDRTDDAAATCRRRGRGGDGPRHGRGRDVGLRLQQRRARRSRTLPGQARRWWVQVYVLQDRAAHRRRCWPVPSPQEPALSSLTVDTPGIGTKDDAAAVWDVTPPDFLHANHDVRLDTARDHLDLEKASDLTPGAIGWLREQTGLPVVVKGVLRGDDARRAVDAGAAAVWVSNHGGRQLDRAIATRWALPEVVDAVRGEAEVYVDGGLRRGTDLLAAYALGATAVFVARPALWALTVAGSGGVTRLVDDLRGELVEAMRLAGCRSLSELTRDLVSGSE